MAKLKRRSISLLAKLRNYFITGIVVLVPIGITLYLTKFFISISSKLIPYNLNPNNYLPFAIPGLEILLSVINSFPSPISQKPNASIDIKTVIVKES